MIVYFIDAYSFPYYLSAMKDAGSWNDYPWKTLTLVSRIINAMAADELGPLLLTWFNFNPSMDK